MDQLTKLLSALNSRQLWTIAVCAIAVAAGVAGFTRWQRESGMRPLYTSLAPEDASAIVGKLRESGVEYRITENGSTLLVPESKVPELRLEMAGLGLPKTGRIGFEIFDKTNFGITDFAEHVNYRRAVEGELERSIMAISEVQQARVHVTLPKDSVFTESREAAKASVLVGLRAGGRLSNQNVTAIINLVSSAVEGLTPESVSVVDMHGNLLSRPRKQAGADGVQTTEAALEYRQAFERDLVAKINNTLEPLLGPDKFRTGVSAEIDMSSGEQSEETFDPAKSVIVSSQKSEDSSTTNRAGATPPGTAANLPQATAPATPEQPAQTAPAAPAAPAGQTGQPAAQQQASAQQTPPRTGGNVSGSSRRSESVTFQSSRTTKHVKLPQGTVKRLSIAVLIDQGSKWEGEGKQLHRVVLPADPEKLKGIQSLVGTLVGFDMQRGDQLTVEALPFDGSITTDPGSIAPPQSQKKTDAPLSLETLKKNPIALWGSVGGGVLLISLVGFVLMRGRKRQVRFETTEVLTAPDAQQAMPVAAPDRAITSANEPPRLPALMPSRSEVLLKQLQESGNTNAEAWVGILRGWLSEEEAN